MIKSIVVLGGGTAGWLTACVIAAKHVKQQSPFTVTLIESPNIPSIGVGEGTWPTMVNTLQQIGISELTFMQKCDASFKQASKFVNWFNNQDNDFFYHPFTPPQSFDDISLVEGWQSTNTTKFADAVSIQPTLCEQHRAPKQLRLGDYKTIENYGYHLDAAKFAQLLTEHGTTQLGIKHILADVTAIEEHENGDIRALVTQQSGLIKGDLFIDCSGLHAALIDKHYQVPFISKKDVLFIDKAIATQVPYPDKDSDVASATISTAQTAGWIWDIGLPTRRGVGHVYSSQYSTEEAAKNALKEYLSESVEDVNQLKFKTLDINPGYREVFWHKNCVAVGMSSGFLEPLEASALVMVELAAKTIALHMPANREVMNIIAQQYNKNMTFRWQRIIDFLKLHYVLSQRDDSDFWRANRDPLTIPQSLQDLLTLWRYQAPENNGFLSPYDLFPAASYQYILYGMGYHTEANLLGYSTRQQKQATDALNKVQSRLTKVPKQLPTNRAILDEIKQDEHDIKIDINHSDSSVWHYVSDQLFAATCENFPVFFKQNGEHYQAIYLSNLSNKTSPNNKPVLTNCSTNTVALKTSIEKLSKLGLIEPVKLDITLNNQSKINIVGLHVINQQKWQQAKLKSAFNETEQHQLQQLITSLTHIPKLIAEENKVRQ